VERDLQATALRRVNLDISGRGRDTEQPVHRGATALCPRCSMPGQPYRGCVEAPQQHPLSRTWRAPRAQDMRGAQKGRKLGPLRESRADVLATWRCRKNAAWLGFQRY